MQVRVIVQTNIDGTKHIIFTQDFLSSVEDLIITRDDWLNSTIKEGRVLIFDVDEQEVLDELTDIDFHSKLGGIKCELMR